VRKTDLITSSSFWILANRDAKEPGGYLQWDEAELAGFTPYPARKEAVYAMDVVKVMMKEQSMCSQ
jgi:hypothetical protein